MRALRFGLVPDELRQQAADDLADLVRKAGTHLGTGFLATPDLLPVLADHGHLDLAYELLFQDTEPSWLAMIDRGATTVWERWEGIDEDGVPHESLNHYSKGAVISFLHRYVAGLQRLEPTWRRFRVQPRPGGGITAAAAEHVSPHGAAAVAGSQATARVTVTVPPGCARRGGAAATETTTRSARARTIRRFGGGRAQRSVEVSATLAGRAGVSRSAVAGHVPTTVEPTGAVGGAASRPSAAEARPCRRSHRLVQLAPRSRTADRDVSQIVEAVLDAARGA